MAYIVKAFTPGKLNLAPETLGEEVLQNVAIIVSTPKFSVPLDIPARCTVTATAADRARP